MEGDILSLFGKVIVGGKGYLHPVTYAVYVENDEFGGFMGKPAGKKGNHASFLRNVLMPAEWAWQIATAKASEASSWATSGRWRRTFSIFCTWSFDARPCPTTACLTWSA